MIQARSLFTAPVLVALFALGALFAAGCDGDGGGKGGDDDGDGGSNEGGSGAGNTNSNEGAQGAGDNTSTAPACDPAECVNFCQGAGTCLFPDDTLDHKKCRDTCKEVCGNGFFDDKDASLMACTDDVNVLDCDGAADCCANFFTSQLCP